ncbi:MAG: pilus assembly protein TadG-related protein, partial [Dongiaceae bacterium]
MSNRRSSLKRLRSLLKEQDGGVAGLVGISLPVLIGFGALGVDIGRWHTDERVTQTAADAAAVGAALELTAGRSGTLTSQAQVDAAINGVPIGGSTTMALNNPPVSGPNAGNSDAVEVIISRPAKRLLSSIILGSDPTIIARAVAIIGNEGEYCVLGLQEVNVAVLVSGSADVVLNCGVAANADLRMNGNQAALTATSATVSGSVTGFDQNLDVPDGATQENAPITDDPYDDLTVPSPLPANGSVTGGATTTYSPGTFNSSISIVNGTHVFEPGTYVLNNSSLTITGGMITGSGVTFVFTGSSAANVGGLDIHGNPDVNFAAPTSGNYAGVAFFQDHLANTSG